MKKETAKKKRLWLWLGIALSVVVVACAALAIFVLPGMQNQEATPPDRPMLYWNVDGATFLGNSEVAGMTSREPDSDGVYRIRFVLDGEMLELSTVDGRLVNYIDSMSVMGLQFDADGMIVDAVDPKTIATEHAKDFYVRSCDETSIVVNSSITMNGMDVVLPLGEKARTYNMTPGVDSFGKSDTAEIMDLVSIYGNESGDVTHIFISQRVPQVDVYHRVDRFYDADNATTTREPDANGAYTILFAHDGQQMELKCKDKDLVTKIDAANYTSIQMGLVFDKEGYIIDTVVAELALRGKLMCNEYDVTSIDGNFVTVERLRAGKEQGQVRNFTVTENTKIYAVDIDCVFDFVGQSVDQITDMDRVICYTDLDNNALLIAVTRRRVESKMFYNKTRKYSDGHTTREPIGGYYVYEMTAEGKSYTLKTKDKEIADKIDGNSYQMMGLSLDGNIILEYYHPSCVSGLGHIGEGRYITSISGPVYRVVAASDFSNGSNFMANVNFKAYDVTGDFNVPYGSETTFQLYDRVNGFTNARGEMTHGVVITRYHEGTKIYYNTSRKYDSETEKTTREMVDGYYVYEMICEGKSVTVKTSSSVLANVIDKQYPGIVAMKVNSSGIVKEAYPAIEGLKYCAKVYSDLYVKGINEEGKIDCYYYKNKEKTASAAQYKVGENCKIYNVSTVFNNYRGELTTLKADDRIVALYDREKKEIVQIFVLDRQIDSPLYWHVKRCYNSKKKETTRTPDANGDYVFELAVNGAIKTFKTKDKAVASAVDAKSTNNAFTLRLKGDTILGVYSALAARDVVYEPGGHRDLMVLNGNKATLVRNRLGADDYGATTELVFNKNCKYFDVSPYAENFGGKTTIGLGDRLKCYTNRKNEVIYCFVTYKNTRQAGHVGLCDHCGKEVFWEHFPGEFYEADGHYYLPTDYDLKSTRIGVSDKTKPQYDIVLDLNGKTLTSTERNFVIYSQLSVFDSAGGGRVEAMGIAGRGGNVLAYQGGVLNIYGGTWAPMAGCEDSSYGGVLYAGSGGTINLYGGTIEGGHVTKNGGCIYIKDANFNMYGGTVTGGTAAGKVSTIYTSDAKINISGGKIDGIYNVDVGTELNLSGKPVIANTGLSFSNDAKINSLALTDGASVMVSSSGVFSNVLSNAESMLKYFVPSTDCAEISVVDGALQCFVNYNKPLTFDAGTETAACAACGKKVQWTKLTNEATKLAKDGHYYLAEDIIYTGTSSYLTGTSDNAESGTVCLHLNGHNITAENHRVISLGKAKLNLMGNGTISGNFSANAIQGATVYANYYAGALNQYGGTITKAESNTTNYTMTQNNGVVNLFADACIEGGYKLFKSNNTDTPKLNIQGSDIGQLDVLGASPVLSGATKIDCLSVTNPEKVTVGELTEGAAIYVRASGVFTVDNDKITDLAKYFAPFSSVSKIKIVGSALLCEKDYKSDLSFATGTTKAVCPVCEVEVEWTALTNTATKLVKGGHYYLSDNIVFSESKVYLSGTDAEADKGAVCLHLNGHNITAEKHRAINVGKATLNLMGDGIISGNFSTNAIQGATVYSNYYAGSLNHYSGTITKAESNTTNYAVSHNNGVVNVFKDAIIEGGFKLYKRTDGDTPVLNVQGAVIKQLDVLGGTANFSGATKIDLLNIAEGLMINLGELVDDAKINVAATGAFTNANDKAADYAKYFAVVDGAGEIKVIENVLHVQKSETTE